MKIFVFVATTLVLSWCSHFSIVSNSTCPLCASFAAVNFLKGYEGDDEADDSSYEDSSDEEVQDTLDESFYEFEPMDVCEPYREEIFVPPFTFSYELEI